MFVFSLFLAVGLCGAPSGLVAPALRPLLRGAIDVHCHSGPDVVPRKFDDLALARHARKAGLRAIVLKSHVTMTADRAALAAQLVPGIEVFGGVALNHAVGGINPAAVSAMATTSGGRGKIVWLPTFDADGDRANHEAPVRLLRNGEPLPGFDEVLRLCAKHDLVLATGHARAQDAIAITRAAHARGVRRILASHVLSYPVNATLAEARTLVDEGATLELVFLAHTADARGETGADPQALAKRAAEMVAAVGAENVVLASDLGQPGNPAHADGLLAFMTALARAGISRDALFLMTHDTPARLLGLANAPATPPSRPTATRTGRHGRSRPLSSRK